MLTVVGDPPKTKKRNQRKYSDEDKANALTTLDGTGGCLENAANIAGVPRNTLRGWSEGQGINENIEHSRQIKNQALSDELFEIAVSIARSMTGEKIEKAGLKDSGIAVGTLIDKSRLLRGDPTSINENRSENAKQIIDRYITESAKDGVSVTRETAIAELSAIMPDLISNEVQ